MLITSMAVLLATSAELAGPPILCDAIAVQVGTFKPDSKLAETAVKALKKSEGTLERLAILRAVAIASMDRHDEGRELMSLLMAAALDAEAAGTPSANAWFDAGFFAAAHQYSQVLGFAPGVAEGAWGYAWLTRAETLAPDDAVIDFALALTVQPGARPERKDLHARHMNNAIAGSESDEPLRKTIDQHLARYNLSVGDYTRDASARR